MRILSMLGATALRALDVCFSGWLACVGAAELEYEFHERAHLFRLFGVNIGPASAGSDGPDSAPLYKQLPYSYQ